MSGRKLVLWNSFAPQISTIDLLTSKQSTLRDLCFALTKNRKRVMIKEKEKEENKVHQGP